ncbi:UNVERIFIED_ORG: hypothetical protein C7432_1460 [Pantoea allii]|jgi:hypothetical protein|nr:hypothetical protein SAMN03097714_0314 [Pantoea ananatis]
MLTYNLLWALSFQCFFCEDVDRVEEVTYAFSLSCVCKINLRYYEKSTQLRGF